MALSAAEMGLSKAEFEDAVNLEKLYFLANNNDRCALCSRGGVSAVDTHRYEFLCSACTAGKASAKKIGADRFSTFEIQKLQNKFGVPTSSRAGGGGALSPEGRAGSERRRRRRRTTPSRRRAIPSSPSSRSAESSDESPLNVVRLPSRSGRREGRGSSGGSRCSKAVVSDGGFMPGGSCWTAAPAAANSASSLGFWGSGAAGAAGETSHARASAGGLQALVGVGMGSAPAGALPLAQQLGALARLPHALAQQPSHPAPPYFADAALQQQWRPGPSGLPQQLQPNPYGMQQQGALGLQQALGAGALPMQQQGFSAAGGPRGALPRTPPAQQQQQQQQQLMLHQQPFLQQTVASLPQMQMQQQQQQRNPFASMRGHPMQGGPAAVRPTNPFLSSGVPGAYMAQRGGMGGSAAPFQGSHSPGMQQNLGMIGVGLGGGGGLPLQQQQQQQHSFGFASAQQQVSLGAAGAAPPGSNPFAGQSAAWGGGSGGAFSHNFSSSIW